MASCNPNPLACSLNRSEASQLRQLLAFLPLLLMLAPARGHADKCPNLMLLLDQSSSMTQDPMGFAQSDEKKQKWGIATTALTALNNKYTGLLPLGYSNFPSADRSCSTMPYNVPVGYGNQVAINYAMIAHAYSGGGTPTCTAVDQLAAYLRGVAMNDSGRGQYILLLTDGAPSSTVDCGGTGGCGASPVDTTVAAITAAATMSPPVRTVVVGFGALSPDEQIAMNRMAVAGDVPDTSDPNYRYYRADSADSLDKALDRILKQLSGGDAGNTILCDDTCYGMGCASGQSCFQAMCKPNPCAGAACPAGQSCFTDGVTKSCVQTCSAPCPFGTRCDRGSCVPDACSGSCKSGEMCNQSNSTCVPDPKCANVLCHRSQGCFGGHCIDNPCSYLSCPAGLQCDDWTGMCEPPRPMKPGNELGDPINVGCSYGGASGSADPSPSPMAAAVALGALACWLGLRRRVASRS